MKDIEPTETNNARLARESRDRLRGELPTATPGSAAEAMGYEAPAWDPGEVKHLEGVLERKAENDAYIADLVERHGGLTPAQIDKRTRELERADWLEWRRSGIGGSDIATIMGWSTFADASAYRVWAQKVGAIPPGDTDDRDIFEVGRRMEPMLKTWFQDETGLFVVNTQEQRRHPDIPIAIATIDGEVYEGTTGSFFTGDAGEPLGGVEFKTTRDKPEVWEAHLPDYYQCQGQWQMAVCGWERLWFAVLHNARTFRIYELVRDEADIAVLLEAGQKWWDTYVVTGDPPPLDGTTATAKTLREVYPGNKKQHASLSMHTTAAMLREAKQQKKIWESTVHELESQIKEQMGDAVTATLGEGWSCTWSRFDRTSINTKEFKRLYPAVYDEVVGKAPTSRFTLKDPTGNEEDED